MKPIYIAVTATAGALLMVGLVFAATSVSAGTPSGRTFPLASAATISNTITYQGRLLDSAGNPVNGTRVMTFSLYAQAAGGTPPTSQSAAMAIDRGLFTTHLNVDPALFDGQALWLGVQVEGGPEMTPRQALLPAPYALSLRPGAVISDSFDRFANQGVLHVENTEASNDGGYGITVLNYSGNTWRPAIYGENRGASAGVYGRADGWHGIVGWNVSDDWAGVFGNNIGHGSGVRGESSQGYGGYFTSTGAIGLFGGTGQPGGTGIVGQGTFGVRGQSTDGFGVVGESINDVGVYGTSTNGPAGFFTSTQAIGVHANTASTHTAILGESGGVGVTGVGGGFSPGVQGHGHIGVEGLSDNVGVSGQGTWGIGVHGQSENGIGVLGSSVDDFGVGGISQNSSGVDGRSDTAIGVRGSSITGTGVMGYSQVGHGAEFQSSDGHALVTRGPSLIDGPTTEQIALKRWYPMAQAPISFTVGRSPAGVAFDGVNMWIANSFDDTVSVLQANSGKAIMTCPVGSEPTDVAFDGANMWVTNAASNTVSVLRASDCFHVMTPTVGFSPLGLAFDGLSMWVANNNANTINALSTIDGRRTMTVAVNSPTYLTFDGNHLWVTSNWPGLVTAIRPDNGAVVMTQTVGGFPVHLTFDGANVWISHNLGGYVSALRASDGATVFTRTVGTFLSGIEFDGRNIWVAAAGDNTVSVFRASDGALVMTSTVGLNPNRLAFDGAYMWITSADGTVRKR